MRLKKDNLALGERNSPVQKAPATKPAEKMLEHSSRMKDGV
jgi:hypothetical protein